MNSVLYDAPGPRTRLITIIASIVAVPVLAYAAYRWIYVPLDQHHQFDGKIWAPIVNPGNQYFPMVWDRWQTGWLNTLKAAGLSIVASLIVGSLLALLRRQLLELRIFRMSPLKRLGLNSTRSATRTWVEVWRGTPVVTTLFFVFMVLPVWGIDFDDRLWFLVIGLTLYNSVVIGEILRSGMDGLPAGQREAAFAVGLRPWQTSWLVLYPQALRVMLPSLISQVVVILKDTSLGGLIISYEEALGVSKQMVEAFHSYNIDIGIPMYFSVGVMYIVVNYALSKLAQYLQKRLSKSGYKAVEPPVTALVSQAEASAA
ncbi:amino acid ABC transporter permease [Hamadaea tsunoensis]|uniref:amino acid ABC transporter permease n=1 Tax=Hamadaea tsunoensis TaxID=53368 RepID=UPI00041A3DD0|nr:amino acid ABC transporter permease [Hamadaea tsunoensis]